MTDYRFTAFAVAGELDLNKVGSHLGIVRKYRWEEPLLLHPVTFKPMAGDRSEEQQVYLYYFGGVVFLNCSDDIIRNFSRDMVKISDNFRELTNIKYREQYSLQVESEAPLTITNDYAVMPHYDRAFVDIIAFVIAKSVAFEGIEEQVDMVFDEMEGLIAMLNLGKFGIPDKRLAKLASKILNFKYRSLTYIMILDKPDITWENPEADRFHLTIANLFELSQRYQAIRHKSETLMDITEVFTSLSHARRASRLEWIIIILIFIEIVIYIFQIM